MNSGIFKINNYNASVLDAVNVGNMKKIPTFVSQVHVF